MKSTEIFGKRVFLAGSYPYLRVSKEEYRKAADYLKSLGAKEVKSVSDLKPIFSCEGITRALLNELLRTNENGEAHYGVVALLPNWSTSKPCNVLVMTADALGIPAFNIKEIQRAAMLDFWRDA